MENNLKKDSGIRNRLYMLLLTVLLGMFAGLVIWAFLKLVALCTSLIWETIPASTGVRWITVPVCVLGALAAGLLRKKFGDYPESLNTVMGKIKKEHHYSYHPMLVMLLCAFLPLVLGASVGPEAGLAGIIAALCYWVGDNVTFATLGQLFHSPLFGILAVEEEEGQLVPERMPRAWRLVLYALSTASSFAVIWLLNSIFGKAMAGFPSFSAVPVSTTDGLLALVYIPVGFLLFLFYEGCEAVMGKAAKVVPPVLKETLCGLAIGLLGLVCHGSVLRRRTDGAADCKQRRVRRTVPCWNLPVEAGNDFILPAVWPEGRPFLPADFCLHLHGVCTGDVLLCRRCRACRIRGGDHHRSGFGCTAEETAGSDGPAAVMFSAAIPALGLFERRSRKRTGRHDRKKKERIVKEDGKPASFVSCYARNHCADRVFK